MCLSQLARIETVADDGGSAVAETEGKRIRISLAVLSLDGNAPGPGDWVLVATGLAVERLSDEEAAEIETARAALMDGVR